MSMNTKGSLTCLSLSLFELKQQQKVTSVHPHPLLSTLALFVPPKLCVTYTLPKSTFKGHSNLHSQPQLHKQIYAFQIYCFIISFAQLKHLSVSAHTVWFLSPH